VQCIFKAALKIADTTFIPYYNIFKRPYLLQHKKRSTQKRVERLTHNLNSNHYNKEPNCANNGANTNDTIVINLIKILIDGPEVSLNGSPTVSPTTAAL